MKRELTLLIAFSLLWMSCSDRTVGNNDEAFSQELSSVALPSANSSDSHHSSMMQSSSQPGSSSLVQPSSMVPVSSVAQSFSSGVASSSSMRGSSALLSSSSSTMAISSSAQALQFSGNQVRLPDGCGVIHWADRDEFTCVQDFWVDTTEVTIGAYQALMGRGVSSKYHNGIYTWKASDGVTVVDDGSPCPECPVDAATLYEAMLYANAMTKAVLHSNDTVYSYTGIDSTAGTGIYLRIKGQEIIGLQNLKIDSTKSGFRLPTRGEYNYMCLKNNLTSLPWDDLYPDIMTSWRNSDLYIWSNQGGGGVTHPVGTKKGTTWHLYDLLGNADDWTTTPNAEHPGQFLALGGSVDVNGDITYDIRLDDLRAGFRLVRGSRHEYSQDVKQ